MKYAYPLIFPVLILLLSFPMPLHAEKVAPLNPDCEVCPVVISYVGAEAHNLLGVEAYTLILKLKGTQKKTVKIDLDGLKKPGSETDSDDGYELLVFAYPHQVVINSLLDGSAIKIVTDIDYVSDKSFSTGWSPELQISIETPRIERQDTLETAWDKFKTGAMYGYIEKTEGKSTNEKLRQFLVTVLKGVTRK